MRIAIATPTLIEGDAVGNDILGMYITLSKAGHEVKLYTDDARFRFPSEKLKTLENTELYIYHFSIGWDSGVKKFKELSCHKVIKYHNITPPHFFNPGSNEAIVCEAGLNQINILLSQPCEVWADSEYNGIHLQNYKPTPYKVVPPFNQMDMLDTIEPDYNSVLPFNDWSTNILMVGRVVTNKNVISAVEGFSEYHKINNYSRLIIVGEPWGNYARLVFEKARSLGIENHILITGKVSIESLKAWYLIADILLITSKHEGFCVPMVEAMGLNVPVVSVKHCALPYTGGDAVQFVEDNPTDIASGIQDALKNRIKLIEKGRTRFRQNFQNSKIADIVLGIVTSMVQK